MDFLLQAIAWAGVIFILLIVTLAKTIHDRKKEKK